MGTKQGNPDPLGMLVQQCQADQRQRWQAGEQVPVGRCDWKEPSIRWAENR